MSIKHVRDEPAPSILRSAGARWAGKLPRYATPLVASHTAAGLHPTTTSVIS